MVIWWTLFFDNGPAHWAPILDQSAFESKYFGDILALLNSPYHIISCYISYHISYHMISYHIVSYHVTLGLVIVFISIHLKVWSAATVYVSKWLKLGVNSCMLGVFNNILCLWLYYTTIHNIHWPTQSIKSIKSSETFQCRAMRLWWNGSGYDWTVDICIRPYRSLEAHTSQIYTPGVVFSYKLRYIAGFWLVEMAISTNQKPAIYRNLYENTSPGPLKIQPCSCDKSDIIDCDQSANQ